MSGRVECGIMNENVRGSSYDRRRRREWLLEHYRADTHFLQQTWEGVVKPGLFPFMATQSVPEPCGGWTYKVLPACRCYRCGVLLTMATMTVDRIIPGRQGGTYRRNNIRPACAACNSDVSEPLRSDAAKVAS